MQHDRQNGSLQVGPAFDWKIDRLRRFWLHPIAQTPECSIGGNYSADLRRQRIEKTVPLRHGLHDHLKFCPMLVMIHQR